MPHGKPAGVRCANLTDDNLCVLFATEQRPRFCTTLMPSEEMCGTSPTHAMQYLRDLERSTTP